MLLMRGYHFLVHKEIGLRDGKLLRVTQTDKRDWNLGLSTKDLRFDHDNKMLIGIDWRERKRCLSILEIILFSYWLCWVSTAAQGFSLVVASRGHSLVVVPGLLIAVASLVAEHRLWGVWASVVVVSGLCSTDSEVAEHTLSCSLHVVSSWTRDWSHVSCTGRWILYQWATREGLRAAFLIELSRPQLGLPWWRRQ